MAREKDQHRPRRGPRTFGLLVAGAVATAPSLGCKDSTSPTPDTGVAVVVVMDAAAPVDTAPPVDTAAPGDAAADLATAISDTAPAMDALTNSEGGADARDADIDVYPPGVRG
jgi:hypothetical protein